MTGRVFKSEYKALTAGAARREKETGVALGSRFRVQPSVIVRMIKHILVTAFLLCTVAHLQAQGIPSKEELQNAATKLNQDTVHAGGYTITIGDLVSERKKNGITIAAIYKYEIKGPEVETPGENASPDEKTDEAWLQIYDLKHINISQVCAGVDAMGKPESSNVSNDKKFSKLVRDAYTPEFNTFELQDKWDARRYDEYGDLPSVMGRPVDLLIDMHGDNLISVINTQYAEDSENSLLEGEIGYPEKTRLSFPVLYGGEVITGGSSIDVPRTDYNVTDCDAKPNLNDQKLLCKDLNKLKERYNSEDEYLLKQIEKFDLQKMHVLKIFDDYVKIEKYDHDNTDQSFSGTKSAIVAYSPANNPARTGYARSQTVFVYDPDGDGKHDVLIILLTSKERFPNPLRGLEAFSPDITIGANTRAFARFVAALEVNGNIGTTFSDNWEHIYASQMIAFDGGKSSYLYNAMGYDLPEYRYENILEDQFFPSYWIALPLYMAFYQKSETAPPDGFKIEVLSPQADDEVIMCGEYFIMWYDNIMVENVGISNDKVDIELFDMSGNKVKHIASGVSGDNVYKWQVPQPIEIPGWSSSMKYRIKITSPHTGKYATSEDFSLQLPQDSSAIVPIISGDLLNISSFIAASAPCFGGGETVVKINDKGWILGYFPTGQGKFMTFVITTKEGNFDLDRYIEVGLFNGRPSDISSTGEVLINVGDVAERFIYDAETKSYSSKSGALSIYADAFATAIEGDYVAAVLTLKKGEDGLVRNKVSYFLDPEQFQNDLIIYDRYRRATIKNLADTSAQPVASLYAHYYNRDSQLNDVTAAGVGVGFSYAPDVGVTGAEFGEPVMLNQYPIIHDPNIQVWAEKTRTLIGLIPGEANSINNVGGVAGQWWNPGNNIIKGFYTSDGCRNASGDEDSWAKITPPKEVTDLYSKPDLVPIVVRQINDLGYVVGTYMPPSSQLNHGYVWQACSCTSGTFTDLDELLKDHYQTDWDFVNAISINNSNYVVGNAEVDGKRFIYRAKLPLANSICCDNDEISFRLSTPPINQVQFEMFQNNGTEVIQTLTPIKGADNHYYLKCAFSVLKGKTTRFVEKIDPNSLYSGSAVKYSVSVTDDALTVNPDGDSQTFDVSGKKYCGRIFPVQAEVFQVQPSSALGKSTAAYPVPATEKLNVRLENTTLATLVIRDLMGKIVLQKENASAQEELSIEELTPGIYILEIHTATGVQVSRIVKR